jgi:hypothetical protein
MTHAESMVDTYKHIETVRTFLHQVIEELLRRSLVHDQSKLESPEAEIFALYTPKLADCEYGSAEYKGYLDALKPALEHHYAACPHHPEHHPDGIRGMSLLDLIEMLCDWAAATKRHKNGSISRSIEINQERFGYGDELKSIFHNTIAELRRLGTIGPG